MIDYFAGKLVNWRLRLSIWIQAVGCIEGFDFLRRIVKQLYRRHFATAARKGCVDFEVTS